MPYEILSRVLQHLVGIVDVNSGDIYDVATRTTIVLTCQLLCEVFLDCPLVWSKINIGWPRAQYELYTTLARGAPLSVRDSNPSVDPQCYFEVATSVHLYFTIPYPDRRILINETLKRDAPQLKVLTVVETQIQIHNTRAHLTSDLLGGNPCALRELTLVGFQLTSAPNFDGLKRLTLQLCLDGDRLWSFLDIFSHTPQLEDLSIIQRASNSGLPAIVMHQNRVLALQGDHLKTFLPRLLRLHLSDYVLPIWPIVRALRDPALELHLDVIEFSKSLDAWSQYHDNVLAHIKGVWQQKTGTGYPSSGTYTINLAFSEPSQQVDHRLSYDHMKHAWPAYSTSRFLLRSYSRLHSRTYTFSGSS
jgi:hypothetical protein